MSPIRALERDDLPAVADLYERVMRSGATRAPAGLAEYFARTWLDHPWADPEIPSLVHEDGDARIVGFIGAHVRRFRHGDRTLRMAASGQLVAHPDVRSRGVGALLLRRFLAGPQDFTATDDATDEVRAIWQRLGGVESTGASIAWTRVLAPTGFAAGQLLERRRDRPGAGDALPHGVEAPSGTRALAAIDRLAGRPMRPQAPSATAEPLTPQAAVDVLERLAPAFPLRPAYDVPYLDWLFRELEAVTPLGRLVGRLVRRPSGEPAGWYLTYVRAGAPAHVLQVVAAGDDVDLVLDELLHHVAGQGATAAEGRLDPHLYPYLSGRRCLLHRDARVLLHSRDRALLGELPFSRALLTRLEGDWWMGHHVLPEAELARQLRERAD